VAGSGKKERKSLFESSWAGRGEWGWEKRRSGRVGKGAGAEGGKRSAAREKQRPFGTLRRNSFSAAAVDRERSAELVMEEGGKANMGRRKKREDHMFFRKKKSRRGARGETLLQKKNRRQPLYKREKEGCTKIRGKVPLPL